MGVESGVDEQRPTATALTGVEPAEAAANAEVWRPSAASLTGVELAEAAASAGVGRPAAMSLCDSSCRGEAARDTSLGLPMATSSAFSRPREERIVWTFTLRPSVTLSRAASFEGEACGSWAQHGSVSERSREDLGLLRPLRAKPSACWWHTSCGTSAGCRPLSRRTVVTGDRLEAFGLLTPEMAGASSGRTSALVPKGTGPRESLSACALGFCRLRACGVPRAL
mmetsp:Transcript_22226/g.66754  ORF Transcript_22226/g.66754 Transcript_22226/m.66754 type:complete len:225 (-) Transcript_22226:225-899(-)